MSLIDSHGRKIKKLRLSLTDKCNLRCHYCMPLDQEFMDEKRYLAPLEIKEILQELVELGVEEVRLTGGEPLMRKSFDLILKEISQIGLKKIALTTNGILLDQYFDLFKRHNVYSLNISLDSLHNDNFKKITRGLHFDRVMKNILKAHELGFQVKVNVVMMKGINDHEFLDFVHFAEKTGIEVRFLELMRIGHACKDQNDQFISAKELIDRLKEVTTLSPVSLPLDSTSFNFLTESKGQIGFIASESQAFCGHCSRWRLSADGILRACLLKDDGRSLKGLDQQTRKNLFYELLGMKPLMRPLEVSHDMNRIGG
jgi:cyclic pyranopterin phosphate synthase